MTKLRVILADSIFDIAMGPLDNVITFFVNMKKEQPVLYSIFISILSGIASAITTLVVMT